MSHKKTAGTARNPGWFSKGKSGNPNGRPAARSSAASPKAALEIVMNKTLKVLRNGVERVITAEEGLHHRTYQDAVAGSSLAQREVLRWITKKEAWRAKHKPKSECKAVVRHESPDPDNADDALVLLGIAAIDLDNRRPSDSRLRLLLEPWAVQAALIRRRSATALSTHNLNEIKRCTRDANSLRWPSGDDEQVTKSGR